MKLHLGLRAQILTLVFCASLSAVAQEEETVVTETMPQTSDGNPPLVEVQYHQDNLAPYQERQEAHGAFVGINYESVDLKNYISTLDGKSYNDLFGASPVALIHLSADYKYNTGIGSFAAGLDYGQGEVNSSKSGASRTLKLTRYGVGFKFTADMLTAEPYVAPYVGINLWQMGISEKSPTDSFSATTKMGYNYTLGLLLQLNFLDKGTATESTYTWGLENTFLDLYTTQYAKTASAGDPDTATDFLYGAGLRLEF